MHISALHTCIAYDKMGRQILTFETPKQSSRRAYCYNTSYVCGFSWKSEIAGCAQPRACDWIPTIVLKLWNWLLLDERTVLLSFSRQNTSLNTHIPEFIELSLHYVSIYACVRSELDCIIIIYTYLHYFFNFVHLFVCIFRVITRKYRAIIL